MRDKFSKDKDEVKVPLLMDTEIKDLVDPIVVKRSMLLRVFAVLAVAAIISGTIWYFYFAPPTGAELLDDVVETAGGLDTWNQITDGKFTRTRYLFDEDGKVTSVHPAGYFFSKTSDGFKIVIHTETPDGNVEIGFNGKNYWASKDGQPADPPGVARPLGMMCDSDFCTPTCAAEMAFYRFSIPFKLKDPGVIPAYAGESRLNGRDMQLLDITYEPNVGRDRWVLFIDKETKLIHKIEHYPRVDSHSPPEEIYWSDHKTEAGITFSHRNTYYRSNGKKLEEYVISDVDFTSPLPLEVFSGPLAMN